MVIAIVGSRNPLHHHARTVNNLITAASSAGHTIVTGCCRGIDTITKNTANRYGLPCTVIQSANMSSAALRTRTAQVIRAAQAVYVLPSHNRLPHSGSWLSVSLAVKSGKPVYVLPCMPAMPTWSTVPNWQLVTPPPLSPLSWGTPLIAQKSLFGCPECGGQIINQSACHICPSCGWSACG